MADDAADKDAKNADESAVTSDAEKAESSSPSSAAVESTAEGTTEAAAAEVADFDAEDSEKAKDSGAVEDSDDEDISLEPDEEQNPKRIRGRHWALTAAAIVAIAIVALAAIIGRLYEEQRIEEQSSREALAAAQEFANVMINVDSAKLDESSNKTLRGQRATSSRSTRSPAPRCARS